MAEWHLRHATAGDADAFASCIRAAYAVYEERITDLPAVADGIADDIENHRVWVVEIDQQVVGGIVLILQETCLLVANVAVQPDWAGLGLGGALMAHAEMKCREHGRSELRLSTHVDMPETIGLYAHLGWEETGRDGNRVLMRKAIG